MIKTSLSDADRQKVMVLVVDDMAANRSVLCRQLELHKYNAMSVDSGEAALELLTRIRPDIMLLDYMMPNMNGIEVLRHLRADPATVDLPVIMVTARAENQATVEALEAGADDYVTKPIDYVVLRARIDSQLQKQGNASDLRMSNAALDEKVTMRNLVLADMESELKSEIALRLQHEQELAKRSAGSVQSPRPKTLADLPLAEISQKFNVVFDSVVDGKTPNLALIYELKELLNQLVLDGD
ncbi:response regulator [uncultured Croceicoccus sp.]|uniref:response regulator n=1 Tax=uncultured Croceicoccus sp. TaxID=1295329 RepID=UPI002628A0FE|nr:response regulator [uncultured Croceicoccus sp.]